jgi:hypothetical protein
MVLIDTKDIKKRYSVLAWIFEDDEPMPVKEWIQKYRGKIRFETMLKIVLKEDFFSKYNIRKYGLYCIKEAFAYVDILDYKFINVYNVTERYNNGEVTEEELLMARSTIVDNIDVKGGVAILTVSDPMTMALSAISHPKVSYTNLAVEKARDFIWAKKVEYSITNKFYYYLIENIETL